MSMNSERRSQGGSFMGTLRAMSLGLILGTLVGGTVALLAAPQSGPETLSMLNDRTHQIRDRMMDTANNLRDQVSDVSHEAQKRAKNVMAATRGKSCQ